MIYLYRRGSKYKTNIAIVNMNPSENTHWIGYINEYWFDSHGCPPPTLITNDNNKRTGKFVLSQETFQGKDGYCAVFCVKNNCHKKIWNIEFIPAVLHTFFEKMAKGETKIDIVTYGAREDEQQKEISLWQKLKVKKI